MKQAEYQISLFDGDHKLTINKPIRLIELFAGYGSQALALKYLGANFEHWKICEWAVKSIQAYKDLHFGDDNTDYSATKTQDEVIDYLYSKGISANYNEPMTIDQIKRLGEEKQRVIYNNLIATHNLVSVCNCHASDLDITDTDKYTYIMTYSFPCQDLSSAGKGLGMGKGSGTRSGLLWEVERILDECNGNLPQILLMENVPEVIGTNNSEHFSQWVAKLDSLGYKSKWEILNAKDYGVPQNRARCFMVSWLGNYYYDFPKRVKLEKRLKDILETNVDEKYYLNDDTIERISKLKSQQQPLDHILNDNSCSPCLTARGGGEEHSGMILYGEIKCNCVGMLGGKYEKMHDIARRVYDTNGIAPTQHTCGGGNLETKIIDDNRFFKQAFETAQENECNIGDTIDAYNKKVNQSGTSPTITTRPEGFKTAILIVDGFNQSIRADQTCFGTITRNVGADLKRNGQGLIEIEPLALDEQNGYIRQDGTVGTLTTDGSSPKHNNRIIENLRIRKLTPKECGRLMGVRDNDIDTMAVNQSNSSQYHLYGDSIVVDVLMAIFGQML